VQLRAGDDAVVANIAIPRAEAVVEETPAVAAPAVAAAAPAAAPAPEKKEEKK
jgi:hypothetical protein